MGADIYIYAERHTPAGWQPVDLDGSEMQCWSRSPFGKVFSIECRDWIPRRTIVSSFGSDGDRHGRRSGTNSIWIVSSGSPGDGRYSRS